MRTIIINGVTILIVRDRCYYKAIELVSGTERYVLAVERTEQDAIVESRAALASSDNVLDSESEKKIRKTPENR